MTEPFEYPPASDELKAAVASLVEYEIDITYGKPFDSAGPVDGVKAAEAAALSQLPTVDPLGNQLTDRDVRSQAHRWVLDLVEAGLQKRLCQCGFREFGFGGDRGHGHRREACRAYYEADVPSIDGKKLCGLCHTLVWQEQNPTA